MVSAQTRPTAANATYKHQLEDSKLFKFDTTIVFGQGPVKYILLPEEATEAQITAWNNYRSDPHKYAEPNFWLMQQPRYLAQLTKINERDDLSDEEKRTLREEKINEWQHMGWFASKLLGRQNALAAGCALYTGLTKEVVLTGGKTMCRYVKENFSEERLAKWPSEAELMLDIIKRHYGDLYKKRYGRDIESVIHMEEKAMNTLENFAYTINRHPDVLSEDKRIGFLSAEHHLKRVTILAQIFSIQHASESRLSAQEILQETTDVLQTEMPEEKDEVLECVRLCQESLTVDDVQVKEASLIEGLQNPNYLTYWFGYLGDVKHPEVIQRAMKRLNQPEWVEVARSVFRQIGLDVREYQQTDLNVLSQRDPNKYYMLVEGLKKLKKPEYRRIPQVSL